MKTKQIKTWLPCFSGFYGTIWQADSEEDYQLQYVNDERKSKGLEPAKWDSFKFDYDSYNMQVIKGIAHRLESDYLKPFVQSITVERLVSPREYNFANDSANITVTLCASDEKRIMKYLSDHKVSFAEYLLRYKSCSGFISYYPYDGSAWIEGTPLEHEHKLGAILDFIARNEARDGEDIELDLYYQIEKYLDVINYDELVNGKEAENE